MIRLRTKSVEIGAELYDGSQDSLEKITTFAGETNILYDEETGLVAVWNYLEDQWINVPLGHYVLRGLKDEFYPCEPEALLMKYEVIDD